MANKIKGIYKINNLVTGGAYIGQSSDIQRRMAKHWYTLKNGTHANEHLQHSFNDHGQENFQYEIVEVLNDISEFDEREMYWIDFYKSNARDYGYNIEHGGQHNRIVVEETRLKMRNARLGKRISPEIVAKLKLKTVPQSVREQISKTMKERGINVGNKNPRYGKQGARLGMVNSEETRKKIKESIAGKQVGELNGFYGKKHSLETLAKISLNRKGKGVGRKNTPETIAKMVQKRKEYWINKKEGVGNYV